MIIVYSDIKFYRDVLNQRVYDYWWEIMIEMPEYRAFDAVWLAARANRRQ